MTFRVVIGADHGGYAMKSELVLWLKAQEYDVLDLGASKYEITDDYPDLAEAVAQAVSSGKAQKGIIICGSGVGACIVANKLPGVRASTCHDTYSAHQGVEHDDMNVLCLGARIIGIEVAKEVVMAFLKAKYVPEERFARRLKKVLEIEAKNLKK